MIILLSPAKTMNFQDEIPKQYPIQNPVFSKNANCLNNILKQMEMNEIKQVMNISEKLLLRVKILIDNFTGNITNSRQAIFAYRGAVFKGLDSLSFNKTQMHFAEDSIRILSGLYGILKPFDGIEEYRLDMKTVLKTPNSNNLYSYWTEILTNYFNSYSKENILINLASNEYSKVINFSQINISKINISFGEILGNKIKYPPMYSKMARGQMAGYIIKNLLSTPEQIKNFNLDGYSFNSNLSNSNNFIFTR